ncbi:hypothetical protein CERZMDRAFT_90200 [Cercospora zeae-maydis SCOH1-5]|uniref:Uncharacterized protein n=1 Tax=Cercospora zeae-maydis SCOH1-5 TaxID=717836 RepID=A0A6A6FMV4_9PEZI|nr:hypothetical protein CERZMDRAFT_90200 [Cercospora zeae-maydis SCOH1-5]
MGQCRSSNTASFHQYICSIRRFPQDHRLTELHHTALGALQCKSGPTVSTERDRPLRLLQLSTRPDTPRINDLFEIPGALHITSLSR